MPLASYTDTDLISGKTLRKLPIDRSVEQILNPHLYVAKGSRNDSEIISHVEPIVIGL